MLVLLCSPGWPQTPVCRGTVVCRHASGGKFSWIKSLYLIGVFVSVLGNSRLNLFCTTFHTTFLYSFSPKTLMSFMYSLFFSPFWCMYVHTCLDRGSCVYVCKPQVNLRVSFFRCCPPGICLVYVYTYVLKYDVLLTWNSPNFLGCLTSEQDQGNYYALLQVYLAFYLFIFNVGIRGRTQSIRFLYGGVHCLSYFSSLCVLCVLLI